MDEASLITMNEFSSYIDINRLNEIKDRKTLRKNIHESYSLLCKKFSEDISWDGKTFVYKEMYYDHCLSSLSFNDIKGLLEFTTIIFSENERQKTLDLMLSRICNSKADIIFPINQLKILVPFLDVKEISYIY